MKIYSLNEQEKRARERVCVALDLNDERQILDHVKELSDLVGYFKINSAFTLYGPALVSKILASGSNLFLDLKLHDIPNTLSGYGDAVTRLGVHLVTLHVAGGLQMLKEAVRAADTTAQELGTKRPKLVGVTVLTSIDQQALNSEVNVQGALRDEVLRKARLAAEAGLDGVVCSPAELEFIKPHLPENFFYVTPGVRPAGVSGDDHRRVSSYADAERGGSSLLVVGRAVLDAKDRREAAYQVLREITQGA
jgi:orotidine-5'-phosphate decarboxylase